MLGSTVYEAILDSIRKDKKGLTLSLDEYNRLSPIVNRRILADFAKKFEEGIDISSSVGAFKKLDQTITLTSGIATLPADYYQLIGEPWYTDSAGQVRTLDITTSLQHSKRRTDYLTMPSLTYPTCVVGSEDSSKNIQIRVYPATITSVNIDYIRIPATPFLDYYINDTTLAVTYLTQGQQNVVVATGYTYRDGTTGTKNSATVDWEWSTDDLPLIVAYFRAEMGAILPDQLMVEIGEKDKNAINS